MVVFSGSTVFWQIAIMTATVVTQVIILGRVRPFTLPRQNYDELFNECTIMSVMYHFICFTPFMPDLEVRFYLGYSVCAVVSFHLVYSLFCILKASLRDSKMTYHSY